MPPPDRRVPAVLARPAAAREHERLLVRVGGERFALPLGCVHEALVLPVLRTVPALPEGCLGLVAWRGARLRVHCPGPALGQAAARPAGAVLILRAASGPLAVAVDEVLDVRPVPPDRVRAVPGLRDPFGVVRGVVVDDPDELVADLAPEALAASLPAAAAEAGV